MQVNPRWASRGVENEWNSVAQVRKGASSHAKVILSVSGGRRSHNTVRV